MPVATRYTEKFFEYFGFIFRCNANTIIGYTQFYVLRLINNMNLDFWICITILQRIVQQVVDHTRHMHFICINNKMCSC